MNDTYSGHIHVINENMQTGWIFEIRLNHLR